MKQIALIEDDPKLLKRMAIFLNRQKGLECTITSSSLGEFFECLGDSQEPGLLLLDIELADKTNTLAHLRKIKNLLPDTKILVITGHNHPEYLLWSLQQGADGFFLKGSGLNRLLQAIEATFAGGAFLDPEAAVHMVSYLRKERPIPHNGFSGHNEAPDADLLQPGLMLSAREQQVARGLTAGQSYKEIARAINLSINTVRHYVKVLYKKFDVSNKVQLSNKLKEYVE